MDAAAAGAVDVIISGDADVLSLRKRNGTPILSASDFIASGRPSVGPHGADKTG